MLKRLQTLFSRDETAAPIQTFDDAKMAAAVLLITAAVSDEEYGDEEQAQIQTSLMRFFELNDEEAKELIALAQEKEEQSMGLYAWTSTLKDAYEVEERVRLIELLWEVAYADGVIHHFESNLVRRVAGLIYVPDVEAGGARKRVRARLGIQD